MFFTKNKEKISIHGRSKLKYEQGKKEINFEIEMMSGQPDVVIYMNDKLFWEGETEPLSDSEVIEIKSKIAQKLSEKSLTFECG